MVETSGIILWLQSSSVSVGWTAKLRCGDYPTAIAHLEPVCLNTIKRPSLRRRWA